MSGSLGSGLFPLLPALAMPLRRSLVRLNVGGARNTNSRVSPSFAFMLAGGRAGGYSHRNDSQNSSDHSRAG